MLYSESIPSMDWVLGHPPYNNFFPVIGCEGYSVAEAQIYDNRSTFADEDNPASDLDTAADQAWRLWVSTIGDVTSIRRTMKYPDSLIPTEHEEQHHMAPPPEISDIVEQVFQPQIESPSTDDLAQAQGLEPTINLPSLDVMVREILLLPAISDDFLVTSCHLVAVKDLSGDPLVPLPPLDLEEGEISTPFDLEEGEIFEAQPPRPPSDIDRAFDDLFATQLSNYATSTRRRERKRRCIRPDEAFGERNTGRIKSSQALASLAAQYADSDGEQQLRVTSGAAFRRQGKMSRV
ncbi:hypothetical protein EV426DRAFT_616321 [Tirmania nivea]|nr:hypothetical protein EV426DRAFT_616321 [Tirmania nivea]